MQPAELDSKFERGIVVVAAVDMLEEGVAAVVEVMHTHTHTHTYIQVERALVVRALNRNLAMERRVLLDMCKRVPPVHTIIIMSAIIGEHY